MTLQDTILKLKRSFGIQTASRQMIMDQIIVELGEWQAKEARLREAFEIFTVQIETLGAPLPSWKPVHDELKRFLDRSRQ